MASSKIETGKRYISRDNKSNNRQSRDTYKYELKIGNKVVYVGTTRDLALRQKEHQVNLPGARIEQVGRRTTRSGALKWENSKSRKNGSPMSGSQIRNAARYVINIHRDALRELERH